jgi:hypothetical protein
VLQQLDCLSKVVNWLVLTRLETVTIYDQKGLLEKHVAAIAKGALKTKGGYHMLASDK